MNRITTKEFIERARAVHGDRFDYSKTDYKGIGKKVVIGCPVHGDISVVASGHINKGLGCNQCYFDFVKRKHTEMFLQKSIAVHGDVYNYSLVEYKNTDTKVKIVCPEHGVFETTPYRHMNGVGCPGCNGLNFRGFLENTKKTRLGAKGFIGKSKKIHGEKYDYSKVKYTNNRTNVEIVCPKHGSFFQLPVNHLKGCGCPVCKVEKTSKIFINYVKRVNEKRKKKFIPNMEKLHGGKYDYSETVYTTWNGEIKIICPVHGPFFQKANNHSQGAGCPQCAPSGFDNTLPAILYYLEVDTRGENQPVYKIGITNRTVEQRYSLERDREKIRVIKVWDYPIGFDARKMERKILNIHKAYLYHGDPPLDGVGTAEMFNKDVLCLAGRGV